MSTPMDIYLNTLAYKDITDAIFAHPDGAKIKIMNPIKPSKLDKLFYSMKLSDYDATYYTVRENDHDVIMFEYKPNCT
jgi:hypothetical protein